MMTELTPIRRSGTLCQRYPSASGRRLLALLDWLADSHPNRHPLHFVLIDLILTKFSLYIIIIIIYHCHVNFLGASLLQPPPLLQLLTQLLLLLSCQCRLLATPS